ncbi:MAG: preprotein translocase subunit SecE [Patescibacteria group bacterium]|jgi:preprotein translocase subunit SecE|nr:preprotein translocase subunit SecE [Patescibacteria group bacterium]
MNVAKRFVNYLKESHQELKKVVWPSKKEITTHTMLVIGISLGVALFLGVVDYILTLLVNTVI